MLLTQKPHKVIMPCRWQNTLNTMRGAERQPTGKPRGAARLYGDYEQPPYVGPHLLYAGHNRRQTSAGSEHILAPHRFLREREMKTPNPTPKRVPARTIPIENRSRMVGLSVSSGTGGECAYCHKEIRADSVDYKVDAYVAAGLRTLHFHRICLHLWEPLMQLTLSQPCGQYTFPSYPRHC